MSRIDQNMIAKRQQLVKQTVIEKPGNFIGAIGKEVGSANITDKKSVAGKTARGSSLNEVSARTREMLSSVCPGVLITRMLNFPKVKDVPSPTVFPYSKGNSAPWYIDAPVIAANSQEPITK